MIHLCPAEEAATSEVKDDVSCVMCEYAVTQLDQILGDHRTEVRTEWLLSSFTFHCTPYFSVLNFLVICASFIVVFVCGR